jgi:hypothetical protein
MGVSYYYELVRGPTDPLWGPMITVLNACVDAGVDVPAAVVAYFGLSSNDPGDADWVDEYGVVVEYGSIEYPKPTGYTREIEVTDGGGVAILLDKLPPIDPAGYDFGIDLVDCIGVHLIAPATVTGDPVNVGLGYGTLGCRVDRPEVGES